MLAQSCGQGKATRAFIAEECLACNVQFSPRNPAREREMDREPSLKSPGRTWPWRWQPDDPLLRQWLRDVMFWGSIWCVKRGGGLTPERSHH